MVQPRTTLSDFQVEHQKGRPSYRCGLKAQLSFELKESGAHNAVLVMEGYTPFNTTFPPNVLIVGQSTSLFHSNRCTQPYKVPVARMLDLPRMSTLNANDCKRWKV